MNSDLKYARHMQCKLDTFRVEARKYLRAVIEIEKEFSLQPGENIDLEKIKMGHKPHSREINIRK